MQPEAWSRAKDIFAKAIELRASEREAFLADACRDDRNLRADVSALLRSHERAGEFLESPLPLRPIDLDGCALGPYRIDRRIGAGGMGDVYTAHDTRLTIGRMSGLSA